MQLGNPEIDAMVTLRDYLRSDANAAKSYIVQKELLMTHYGTKDYNAYSKNKRAFLEQLKAAAREWKSKQSHSSVSSAAFT